MGQSSIVIVSQGVRESTKPAVEASDRSARFQNPSLPK
jgi:hypothetical protein